MKSKLIAVSACLVSSLCLTLGGAGEAKNKASVTVVVLAATPLTMSEQAAAFSLKDQYGATRDYSFPRVKASVLAFGDREGSKQIEGWIRPLYERYGERIDIQGVAELSAVPSLARPVVRRIFKRQVKYPVLLDWTGAVSHNYGYEKGRAKIFIVNPSGQVIAKFQGTAAPDTLAQANARLDSLLEK